jgi:hypothetical protein
MSKIQQGVWLHRNGTKPISYRIEQHSDAIKAPLGDADTVDLRRIEFCPGECDAPGDDIVDVDVESVGEQS